MGNMAKYMAMRGAGGSNGGMRGEMRNEMYGGYMRGGEMRYEMNEMRGGAYGRMGEQEEERGYEPESRRRDSRGRFRSEGEMYMPPRSEMNTIGFSAHTWPQSKQRDLHIMRGGSSGGSGGGKKFDEKMAQRWMENLKREDDTEGPVWSIGQIKQAMEQRGIKEDPMRMWVAVNAVYADFCDVAKKYGVNDFEFFLDMGKAFIDDKDAKGDKLLAYFENIVE